MSVDIRPNPASSGAVSGGLVYKGSYNATTNTPDLTSSEKGDFYIVSVGGTLAGITLNVGDHIVFNQDASSPITSAMFDVIDNTDAVASVNGATGVVVLGASDVSALAIANNLNDLNNASTARTNLGVAIGSDVQAYDAQLADIAGLTPTDGNFIVGDGSNFVAESGATARASLDLGTVATLDVGTGANNVIQLDGSSRLPAVDGSQLTNITATDATKLAIANNLSDLNNASTARTNLGVAIGSDVQAYDAQLADIAGLTPTDGNIIVGNGSNFVAESGATARASLGLTIGTNVQAYDAQLADIAGLAVTDGNIIVGDGTNFVAESGLTARTSLGCGSAAALDVGTGANNVVQLDGSSRLPAVDGSQLTNITATDATKLAIANNLSDLNNASTARTNLGVAIGSDVQAHDAQLDDIAGLTPTDGNIIVGNGSNFVAESGATARASLGLTIGTNVQAYDAQLADIAGLTPTNGNFIVGDGTNFVAESGATARASLDLGTAATLDVGTGANNVVQLDGSSRLPAVDGSQLTNLPSSGGFSYTAITSASSPVTSSTGVHYGADSSGGAITFNLPALSGLSGGEEIRIKLNTAGNNLTITPNGSDTIEGAATYVMSIAKEAVTCVASNGTNWEVI